MVTYWQIPPAKTMNILGLEHCLQVLANNSSKLKLSHKFLHISINTAVYPLMLIKYNLCYTNASISTEHELLTDELPIKVNEGCKAQVPK